MPASEHRKAEPDSEVGDASERATRHVHPTWARRPIWTLRRKLLGNLIPMLFSAPFAGIGLYALWKSGNLLDRGLIWLALAPAVGWIALNFTGLFENRKIQREIEMRLLADRPKPTYRRYYVGMATPAYRGVLDPHEDLGILLLHPDTVEYFGERHRVELPRSAVKEIRYRPNIHSWVGLGRWISLEATLDEKPVRLLVELRQRHTLLGNLRMSRTLMKKLRKWHAEG